MTGSRPPITHVTGGSAGMAATYAHIRALAGTYDRAGDRMRSWAATGGRVLANGDLLESSVLSPITFAEAEEKVLAATTGTHGVLVASVLYETDAVLMRATVTAFVACDQVVHGSLEALDYLVGRTIGFALGTGVPEIVVAALLTGASLYEIYQHLPPGLQQRLRDGEGDAADDLQEWLDEHPEVVQHLVNGGGGLLDGLWDGLTPGLPGGPFGLPSFNPTTQDAAGLLAGLYAAEDPPTVTERGDLSVPLGGVQPGSLQDVMRHLAQTNDLSPASKPDNQGTIEVQTIHEPDGTVRYIVYLPGTDDLSTTPMSQDADVRDMATNFNLISGHDTTYEQGIRQAMTQAGIQPGDPVMLAGHSQGGMEAATMLSHGTQFNITNVVTAGAPTAQVDGFPDGSHVLSLENRGDIVPLLDGEDDPDSSQQVTVQFDDHETSIAGNHDLSHYADGAWSADHSDNASIQEQLQSLHHYGFLGPDGTATSQIFQIQRGSGLGVLQDG
jgi:hypothetical protein